MGLFGMLPTGQVCQGCANGGTKVIGVSARVAFDIPLPSFQANAL
jgi:hypothetical protein